MYASDLSSASALPDPKHLSAEEVVAQITQSSDVKQGFGEMKKWIAEHPGWEKDRLHLQHANDSFFLDSAALAAISKQQASVFS